MKIGPGEKLFTGICVLESEKGLQLKNREVEEIDVTAKNKDEAREKIEAELKADYEPGLIVHRIVDTSSVSPVMFW